MDNLVKISIVSDYKDNKYIIPYEMVDQFVDDMEVTPIGRNKDIFNRYNECLLTLGCNSLELWASLPVDSEKDGILEPDLDRIEQVELVEHFNSVYVIPVRLFDEFADDSIIIGNDPFVLDDKLYEKWNKYELWGGELRLPFVPFFIPPLPNMDAIKALARPLVQAKIVDNDASTYVVPLEFLDIFTRDCEVLPEKDFRSKWKPLRLLKENGKNALILYSYRIKKTVKKNRSPRIEHVVFNDQLERFVFERTLKEVYFIPEALQDTFRKYGFHVDDYKTSFYNKFHNYKIAPYFEHRIFTPLPEIAAVNQQKNI